MKTTVKGDMKALPKATKPKALTKGTTGVNLPVALSSSGKGDMTFIIMLVVTSLITIGLVLLTR